MKKIYERPLAEVIELETADVIRTSGDNGLSTTVGGTGTGQSLGSNKTGYVKLGDNTLTLQ